jgi:hypothetical protein
MKTIIIWDSAGYAPIKFLVVKGDHHNLNGIYLNVAYDIGSREDQLSEFLGHLVYDYAGNWLAAETYDYFPSQYVGQEEYCAVIVAGELP